jgi:hypothetical protein
MREPRSQRLDALLCHLLARDVAGALRLVACFGERLGGLRQTPQLLVAVGEIQQGPAAGCQPLALFE